MSQFLKMASSYFKKSNREKDKRIGPAPELEEPPPKEGEIKNLGKIFVGGINPRTTAKQLEEYFSTCYGKVADSVICRDPKKGRSLGYGFVTFADPKTAQAALKVEYHFLNGNHIQLKPYEPKRTNVKNESARLFLGGLPYDMTEENLKLFFSRYGQVTEVVILRDKITKKSKGYGFISFRDETAAEKCMADQFVFLMGRKIHIKKAEARDKSKNEDSMSNCSVFEDEDEDETEDSESDTHSVHSDFSDRAFKTLLENYFQGKLNRMNEKGSQGESDKITEVEKLLSDFLTFSSENLPSSGNNLIEFSGEETESSDDVTGSCDSTTLAKTLEESESSVLQKSMPLQIRNKEGFYMCSLCQWIAPNDSFESFLTHCKTTGHKTKLKDRFPTELLEKPKEVKKKKKKVKKAAKSTTEQEGSEQKSQKKESETVKNLKAHALAKGMSSIQAISENEIVCKMCNKKIPQGLEFDVLMKNVSTHLLSKTHLKKLSQAENLLLNSNKPKQNTGTTEKVKPEPAEPKNSQKKVAKNRKTGKSSGGKFLCLPCNLLCENTEVFNVHLGLKSHIDSLSDKNLKADVSLANMGKCKGCQNYLYGSLYSINKHCSKCIEKKN